MTISSLSRGGMIISTTFGLTNLTVKGEWDEVNKLVIIKEVKGQVDAVGKPMGFNLNIRGNLRAEKDNRLHLKVDSIGFIPSLFLPFVLKLVQKLNLGLHKAITIQEETIALDPNSILPEKYGIQVLFQPDFFELSDESENRLTSEIEEGFLGKLLFAGVLDQPLFPLIKKGAAGKNG